MKPRTTQAQDETIALDCMCYSQRGLGRESERTRGGGFGVEALADNDSSWKDKKLRGDVKTVCDISQDGRA